MKVIVGIDGSAQQADALALGSQLARVDGGHLTIANAYPWSRAATRLGSAYHLTVEEDAKELLAGAEAMVSGVECTTRAIADPSPARALHALAEEEGADILVVGSCHRGPVGRAVLGGVADRLVHGAPCAVAVAPRGYAADGGEPRRIGVAYDGSPESREALAWAGRFAERIGGSVSLVMVYEPVVLAVGYPAGMVYDSEEIDKKQRAECGRMLDEAVASLPPGVEPTSTMVHGAPGPSLAAAAEDVDLMVTGSRGYGPSRTTVLGSVSRSLIHHSPRPVVVLPRGASETQDAAGPVRDDVHAPA